MNHANSEDITSSAAGQRPSRSKRTRSREDIATRAPEILLTLSPGQYEQLRRDVEALRKALRADSNTQAILEAIHRQAEEVRVPQTH
jgi:hypothetical protein